MNATEYYTRYHEENPETFDALTLGHPAHADTFLANRLYKAFMAGVNAGKAMKQHEISARVAETLFG